MHLFVNYNIGLTQPYCTYIIEVNNRHLCVQNQPLLFDEMGYFTNITRYWILKFANYYVNKIANIYSLAINKVYQTNVSIKSPFKLY